MTDVRGKGWKFIRYHDGQEYLYDLNRDAGETRNLAHDPRCRSHRKELTAEMEEWLRRTGWPGLQEKNKKIYFYKSKVKADIIQFDF